MTQTFGKDERLHKKILIKKLFTEGVSFYVYPFRVTTLKSTGENVPAVQLLISVPKHLFKKATDRNLLKRRIREAYRKNKQDLCTALGDKQVKIALCFNYTAKTILPFSIIQDKIIILLQRLLVSHGKTPG
jgi:ribonuclease P protein component